MNYGSNSVVERLSKPKNCPSDNQPECYFSPKILPRSRSLKRAQPISELLFEDSIRRSVKKNFIEFENQTTNSSSWQEGNKSKRD